MTRPSALKSSFAALLSAMLLLSACGTGTSQGLGAAGPDFDIPAGTDLSRLPQYLQLHTANYDQFSKDLKDTLSAYSALEGFKWQEMENLGFWEVQTAGVACQTYDRIYQKDEPAGVFASGAKWIALNTMIPSPERVKTIGLSLSRCREAAARINPPAFYSNLSAVDDTRNREEWLGLCRGLDSSLKSAQYLAATLEKTSNFATVNESFKQASTSTRDRYLGKFQEQSKQFGSLLSVLVSRLGRAEASAAKLAGLDSPGQ
jgi:hypothetical protein